MKVSWNNTWTPERQEWLARLVGLGWTWRKIGLELGISGSTVGHKAGQLGLRIAKPDMFWPKERDMQLQQLVFEVGLSYSQAAKQMGMTKNALIGRASRLGLVKPMKVQSTMIERLDALNIFPPAGRCLYPIGHHGEEAFHFCGGQAHGGPYCARHRVKTCLPPKKGREAA